MKNCRMLFLFLSLISFENLLGAQAGPGAATNTNASHTDSTSSAPSIFTSIGTPKSRDSNGLGISLGSNSGFTGYIALDADSFAQGVLGFNASGGYGLSADYAIRRTAPFKSPDLDFYYGLGVVVGHGPAYWTSQDSDRWKDRNFFGMRIPLGLIFWVPGTALQFSPELAPTYVIGGYSFSTIDGSIAVRLMF